MDDEVPDLPEEKSKKRTAVEVAGEGALGAIPFVGSLLAASLSHISPLPRRTELESGWRRWRRSSRHSSPA